jgi:hypothetical protein|nr:MAG TPA: hypothetical protein [Caudoviricetes sp.]
MNYQEIKRLTTKLEQIEKKIKAKEQKRNEEIEMLKLEFEEISDQLTTEMNF